MPPEAAPLLQAAGVDAGYGTMQVLWGVDLDVRHPVHQAGHVGQDHPGGPARGTECGRELNQGRAPAERVPQLRLGEKLSSAGAAVCGGV